MKFKSYANIITPVSLGSPWKMKLLFPTTVPGFKLVTDNGKGCGNPVPWNKRPFRIYIFSIRYQTTQPIFIHLFFDYKF